MTPCGGCLRQMCEFANFNLCHLARALRKNRRPRSKPPTANLLSHSSRTGMSRLIVRSGPGPSRRPFFEKSRNPFAEVAAAIDPRNDFVHLTWWFRRTRALQQSKAARSPAAGAMIASALPGNSASSTASSTNPHSTASAASRCSARSSILRVAPSPTARSSRATFRLDRQLPTVLAIGTPKRARVEARRRSQAVAIIKPPPIAAPSITARVGPATPRSPPVRARSAARRRYRPRRRERQEFGDIGAGDKGPASAAKYRRPSDRTSRQSSRQALGKLVVHRQRHRIARFRPIETYRRDRAFEVEADAPLMAPLLPPAAPRRRRCRVRRKSPRYARRAAAGGVAPAAA